MGTGLLASLLAQVPPGFVPVLLVPLSASPGSYTPPLVTGLSAGPRTPHRALEEGSGDTQEPEQWFDPVLGQVVNADGEPWETPDGDASATE